MMNTITLSETSTAELFVLVFRTNVRYKKDVKKIASELNLHPMISKWNVDLDDDDRILRIVSKENNAAVFVAIVENAGFSCEELID